MRADGNPDEDGDLKDMKESQMTRIRTTMLAIVAVAALGATPSAAAPSPVAAAKALQHGGAGRRDRILRTATVEGRVTGMTMGDYLWVTVRPGRGAEFQAQPGASPVDLFLDAHRNQPLTLQVQDVSRYVPEAGGRQEIKVIAGARLGRTSAAAWWRGLSPAQRRAAQHHFDQGALSSGGR